MANTTIQISTELLKILKERKLHDNESYESVIRDLMEDTKELNEQTKKEIAKARKEIKEGKYSTLEEVKKELGI
ncbi:hypothetical protein KAW38_00350 [Candidatus Micrarchaeota archaeon]|nr:hypothetical protein [Candidatus Micrarchaeota archaeon]